MSVALLKVTDDEDDVVRAEALLWIGMRAPQLLLPVAAAALSGDQDYTALIVAAEIIADLRWLRSLNLELNL